MGKYLTAFLVMIMILSGIARAGDDWAKSRRRNKTREKINKIIIPKLTLEDVPVSVAFEILKQRSRELDPDGEGVNFVVILKPAPHEKKAKAAGK